ncbi:MAG: single-strand DNA-binding protein [Trebonia sp.]|nr:single-strand DNA-binding protein [Trebonia sp.]
MSQDNQITLRGYLTAEPRLHQKTATATPVTEIRVGSTPRRLNRETGEWRDATTSYFTVKCWRRLAINAASSLHKGDMVVVRGRFYTNNWVDSQQRPRSTLEIEADSVGHDLAYGWSHYLRGTRSQSERSAGVNAGEMSRQDIGSANLDAESANPDVGDDEYSAYGDPADPADQADQAPVVAITESDRDGGLELGDVLAAPGLTDGASLLEAEPDAEVVPF